MHWCSRGRYSKSSMYKSISIIKFSSLNNVMYFIPPVLTSIICQEALPIFIRCDTKFLCSSMNLERKESTVADMLEITSRWQ